MRSDLDEMLREAGEDPERVGAEKGPKGETSGATMFGTGYNPDWIAAGGKIISDELGYASLPRFLGELEKENVARATLDCVRRSWPRSYPTRIDAVRLLIDYNQKLFRLGKIDWLLDQDPAHIRTTVRLTKQLHRAIRIAAAEKGVSSSDVIETALAPVFVPPPAIVEATKEER
jgi:hypothetical protein